MSKKPKEGVLSRLREDVELVFFIVLWALFALVTLVLFWVDWVDLTSEEDEEPECGGGCVGCDR